MCCQVSSTEEQGGRTTYFGQREEKHFAKNEDPVACKVSPSSYLLRLKGRRKLTGLSNAYKGNGSSGETRRSDSFDEKSKCTGSDAAPTTRASSDKTTEEINKTI